jgi:ferritin-like metal-binding protein YciE
MDSLAELFHVVLQDVYFAEKQWLKTLPRLAKNSTDPKLGRAFLAHRDETQAQIGRLEQVFALLDKRPKGRRCAAVMGIIEEAEDIIEEAEDDGVRDAGILAAAQAAEHYEIARYGTLVAWAGRLGEQQAVKLLQQTLDEEKNADRRLSEIAEGSVNKAPQAA